MGPEIATAYVKIRPDVTGFKAGVDRGVTTTAKKSGTLFGNIFKLSLAKVMAGAAAIFAGFQFVKGGITRLIGLEEAESRLKSMGIGGKQTTKLMEGLLSVLKGTAFALDEGATTMTTLVTAGLPLNKVTGVMKLIADTAAFAKVPLGDMGTIFQEIITFGKVTGDQLFSMQVRGVPALELLASAAGVSNEEMKRMVSEGEISANEFFRLWKKGSAGFGKDNIKMAGAAKDMGDTTKGAWANMVTAFNRFLAGALDPFFTKSKDTFTGVTKFLDDFGKVAIPAIENFAKWLFDVAVPALIAFGAAVGPHIAGAVRTLVAAISFLAGAFSSAFNAVGGVIDRYPIIGTILKVIAGIVTALFIPALIKLAVQTALSIGQTIVLWTLYKVEAIKAMVLTVARMAWMGAQSIIQGAKVAAGLVIAMGPIGWVIAAIVGLTALVVANWDTISRVIPAAWETVKTSTIAVWNTVTAFISNVWNTIYTTVVNALTKLRDIFVNSALGQTLIDQWNTLVAGVTIVWNAIVTVVRNAWNLAVSIITGGLAQLRTAWDIGWSLFSAVLTPIWNAIATIVRVGIDFVTGVLSGAMQILRAAWTASWSVISAVAQNVWTTITNIVSVGVNVIRTVITTVLNVVFNTWKAILGGMVAFYTSGWNTIKQVVTTVFNQVRSFIIATLNGIRTIWDNVWNAIRNIVTTVFNAIRSFITTVLNAIRSIWETIWNAIRNFVSDRLNNIRTNVTTVINAIRSVWQTVWTAVRTFLETVWNAIRNFISERLTNIRTNITNVVNTIRTAWSDAWGAIQTRAQTVWNNIRDGAGNLREALGNIFNQIKGRIATPINWIINNVINRGIIRAWNALVGFLGFDGAKIGNVPTIEFARGGVVPGVGDKDTVPALLTPGEYVIRKDIVRMLGKDTLDQVNNAAFVKPTGGDPSRAWPYAGYAKGGMVSPKERSQSIYARRLQRRLRAGYKVYEDFSFPGMGYHAHKWNDDFAQMFFRSHPNVNWGWKNQDRNRSILLKWLQRFRVPGYQTGGAVQAGGIVRASQFAKSQHGKPYIWAGVGPAGYDCSGFMSAILNVLEGKSPYSRRFATGSIAPSDSLAPGLGPKGGFSIGSYRGNPGHMAGTLGGVNVEAGGSPSFTKYNAGIASGADHPRFVQHFHAKKGGVSLVDLFKMAMEDVVNKIIDGVQASISSNLSGIFKTLANTMIDRAQEVIFNSKAVEKKFGGEGAGGSGGGGFLSGGYIKHHTRFPGPIDMAEKYPEVVAPEPELKRMMIEALAQSGNMGTPVVNVYIGSQKINEIAKVQIQRDMSRNRFRARAGG